MRELEVPTTLLIKVSETDQHCYEYLLIITKKCK